jgi:hypothetical protein
MILAARASVQSDEDGVIAEHRWTSVRLDEEKVKGRNGIEFSGGTPICGCFEASAKPPCRFDLLQTAIH